MKKLVLSAALVASSFAASQAAVARDTISIVGSSTVYPFATVVAERFGKSTDFKAPKIESTGSGGGLKLFCKGVGIDTPDITNASRRIKKSEVEKCAANGVKDITEVLIGFDGIVLANSNTAPQLTLSRKDIYMALAKWVPGKDGKLIENPHKTWKDVNASLPAVKIEVLGPPPSSGTRDAFAELALGGGAKKVADLKTLRGLKANQKAEIEAMIAKLGVPAGVWEGIVAKKGEKAKGKDVFKKVAYGVREDGAYIEAGENDNLIVQKLSANPNALGIFGYSFLEQNSDKVHGSIIDGQEPTFEAIAAGEYKVSRPLYFYVKKAHIGTIPGIQEYVNAFIADGATGEEGYLVDKGLIPLGADQRSKVVADAKGLSNLAL
ncbi:MAG: substrate-binding domain-containing protein [Arenicella sp.]